jgi:hypothetical protein
LGGSDESDPYLDIPKRYAETALGSRFSAKSLAIFS